MDDIEQKVKKIIAEQLGIKEEDIKNESSFIEDLGADSLTTVEMSLALEDAFDIEIPDTEPERKSQTFTNKISVRFSRPSTSSRPPSRSNSHVRAASRSKLPLITV